MNDRLHNRVNTEGIRGTLGVGKDCSWDPDMMSVFFSQVNKCTHHQTLALKLHSCLKLKVLLCGKWSAFIVRTVEILVKHRFFALQSLPFSHCALLRFPVWFNQRMGARFNNVYPGNSVCTGHSRRYCVSIQLMSTLIYGASIKVWRSTDKLAFIFLS